jgi:hypothetical protein
MNLVLNNPADQIIEEAQVLQTDRKNYRSQYLQVELEQFKE